MPSSARITRARFVLGPFTAENMLEVGGVLRDVMAERINKGMNVGDAQSKPLKPGRNGRRGYPDYKQARGLQPIRDWVWTGRLMRSMKVKTVSENRAVIGFIDPRSDRVAHINNVREKQFGISPKDRKAMNAAVRATLKQQRIIRVRKQA